MYQIFFLIILSLGEEQRKEKRKRKNGKTAEEKCAKIMLIYFWLNYIIKVIPYMIYYTFYIMHVKYKKIYKEWNIIKVI